MPRYRMKPVEKEAVLWDYTYASDPDRWDEWVVDNEANGYLRFDDIMNAWFCDTSEGTMRLLYGHYLIHGLKGEIYPCMPDVFEQTYELIEDVEIRKPNDE